MKLQLLYQKVYFKSNEWKDLVKNIRSFDPSISIFLLSKNIFLNEEVENYEKNRLKTEAIIIDHVTVNPLYIFKGKIYSAYLFNVVARENIDSLNEKLFLNLDLKNKRAISIKDKKIIIPAGCRRTQSAQCQSTGQ